MLCGFSQSWTSFREYLKRVLRAAGHRAKHLSDELDRDVWVEEITHRVYKDDAGRSPPGGSLEQVFM